MLGRAARLKRPVPGRARVLETLVQHHGWTCGAELGVFRGDTFLHLLRSCPDLCMVGVDTWRHGEVSDAPGARTYEKFPLERYHKRLCDAIAPYGSRAGLMRLPTVAAAAWFTDRHFDFVFIDADHTYEGVAADIAAWTPKVKPGGMLLGHDWNERDFPGVLQAVSESFGEPALYWDTVWGVAR